MTYILYYTVPRYSLSLLTQRPNSFSCQLHLGHIIVRISRISLEFLGIFEVRVLGTYLSLSFLISR